MYKIETHCHTAEVSGCARVTAEKTVELYKKAGYSGIILTNHFSEVTFKNVRGGWKERIDFFMKGYHMLCSLANDMDILLGMELRCSDSHNDYLVYGITESFLRKYNNSRTSLIDMKINEASEIIHSSGLLIYQAHPFRNNMKVVDPALLDGIEVYNGHNNHASRNDIAEMWADKYHLRKISGSDFHYPQHEGRGGILCEHRITNNKVLLEVLNNNPELIRTPDGFNKN